MKVVSRPERKRKNKATCDKIKKSVIVESRTRTFFLGFDLGHLGFDLLRSCDLEKMFCLKTSAFSKRNVVTISVLRNCLIAFIIKRKNAISCLLDLANSGQSLLVVLAMLAPVEWVFSAGGSFFDRIGKNEFFYLTKPKVLKV